MNFFQVKRNIFVLSLACFGGAFLYFLFTYAVLPISDPDFWWHLKTGETMIKQKGLLQIDPFTFSSNGIISDREAIILKGYWLWQLTAYSFFSIFGFHGVHLLNLVTIGTMAWVVVKQMRQQHVDYAIAAPLVALGFYQVSVNYVLERPQIVSFLFAAILLGLLSRVREGGDFRWTLPSLMALWGNLHGGFVVGDLILLCFAAGACIEYRHNLPRLRHVLLWIGVAIGASLLNPNGALAIREVFRFQNSTLMVSVAEYRNTWDAFNLGAKHVSILWLLVVLYGIGIWTARRLYWPEFLTALFLAYISIFYVRNLAFFSIAMLPTIGFYLQKGATRIPISLATPLTYLLIFMFSLGLTWKGTKLWDKRQTQGMVSSFYSDKATNFILDSGLQGHMLNNYNVGGYQIWRLFPRHQVFIDGRGLDPKIFQDWKLMISASLTKTKGQNEFESLLDYYGIDYVIQPLLHPDNGRLISLFKFLINKPEWIPIYIDSSSYIIAKILPKNRFVIDKYKIDKRIFNEIYLRELYAQCKKYPSVIQNHIALAEMLMFIGQYSEAENRLDLISRMDKEHPELPKLHIQLDALRKG